MVIHAICNACRNGNHEDHDGRHSGPPGIIGGEQCMCPGDCKPQPLPNDMQLVVDALQSKWGTVQIDLCEPCKHGNHDGHLDLITRCPCEGACVEKVRVAKDTTDIGLPSFHKLPEMTLEEMMAVMEVIVRWLSIKEASEYNWKNLTAGRKLGQLPADLWHSALLRRMLVERKLPLAIPPPTRGSYPDYDNS